MQVDLYNRRDICLNLPENITWDQFCVVLEELRAANQKLQWVIGDALLFCERKWKDKIEDAKLRTSLSSSTLAQYILVSRAFPSSDRSLSLGWSLHLEAMRAEPNERLGILKKAEQNNWSRRDIRLAIGEHSGEQDEKGGTIGFIPAEWALEMKRWIGTQPPMQEWDAANLELLKSRFDKDIIPIYQTLCSAIAKVKELEGRL